MAFVTPNHRLLIAVLLVGMAAPALSLANDACSTTNPVDSGGYVGNSTSIAVDSDGYCHVSTYKSQRLWYFTNRSGSWIGEPVAAPASGEQGRRSSIALDSKGSIHISYVHEILRETWYATNSSGTWECRRIDSNHGWTALAVDQQDRVHIVYQSGSSVKYVLLPGDPVLVASFATPGECAPALALDSNDAPHIVYYDLDADEIGYATNASGIWQAKTLREAVRPEFPYFKVAIDLDSADNVHICYADPTGRDLRYVTNETGAWEPSQAVDGPDDVGAHCSLVVDSRDRVHIVYADYTNLAMKYAVRPPGCDWQPLQTIAAAGNGWYTSIVAEDYSANTVRLHVSVNTVEHNMAYTTIFPDGIPGDNDGDCDVDLADLGIVLSWFGFGS